MNRRELLIGSAAAGLAATLHAGKVRAAPSERKLRVGIVGHTGRGDYGHGLNTMWLNLPETEIVAVADPDVSGRKAALRKLGVDQGFDDYRQMIAEMKPDLVAIGMRHVDQHRDVAVAAAKAGVRGIYVEKPMCRTPAEADEIVAACEASHTKLAVAHRNRYHPVLPVVARLMQDGTIGRVLELRGRGKEDPRGGSLDLYVLGSHVLNMINFFGGKPVACTATVLVDLEPIEAADVQEGAEGIGPLAGNEVHARYEMDSGITAFFDSVHDAGTRQSGFGLQIVGTQGVIDLRMDQDPLAHLLAGSPFAPTSKPRTWVPISSAGVDQPEPDSALGKELRDHLVAGRDLVAAMREDRQPLCNMYEGRTVIEMIAAVFESQRLGCQRVTFPLQTRDSPLVKLS